MKKIIFPIILFAIFIVFLGCEKKDREEVISTYHTGEKKETAIFEGEKTKRRKLKSFEYYKTGEKKREYNFKDNHYYGPWTYWYKDGTTMAEGVLSEKTLKPFKGIGRGTYYWPGKRKMIELEVNVNSGKGRESKVVYYDWTGNSYSNDNLPSELKENIRSVIARWEKGEI
jgi:antitoxin component YwqK of YwqJK toxin-antitoxin module